MYIRICVYVCVYAYIGVHTYIHIHRHIYIYQYIHIYTYIYVYIYTYIYMYIYIYIYIYKQVYEHIHTYVFLSVSSLLNLHPRAHVLFHSFSLSLSLFLSLLPTPTLSHSTPVEFESKSTYPPSLLVEHVWSNFSKSQPYKQKTDSLEYVNTASNCTYPPPIFTPTKKKRSDKLLNSQL